MDNNPDAPSPTDSPADHSGAATDASISPDGPTLAGRPPGAPDKAKRGPGRPKGSPKPEGSGRKSGVRNVASREAKEEARAALNANGARVIRRAVHVACGGKIRDGKVWKAPSEAFQAQCMKLVANKLLPDLQSQQLDARIESEVTSVSDTELALWISRKLSEATFDDDDTESPHDMIPNRVHTVPHKPRHLDHIIDITPPAAQAKPVATPSDEDKLNQRIDEHIERQRTRPQAITGYNNVRRR